MMSEYGSRTNSSQAIELAVGLAPADPEAHYARAALLADAGNHAEAIRAYERTLGLRPGDYVLWVELGKLREQSGDAEGAIREFREAVRRAPFYADPRWQLGNTLLRQGREEEAFDELRLAATVNPRRYPRLIALAWHASGGSDARRLIEITRPQHPSESLLVARYLIKQNHAGEAMRLIRERGVDISEADRRTLLDELLDARRFREAHELWASTGSDAGTRSLTADDAGSSITDGSFERELRFDAAGFGWQIARRQGETNVKLSLDATTPRAGARSLRIDFGGNSAPSSSIISQLVLVEGGRRYRLSFSARTQDLITGGLPFIRITDAGRAAEAREAAAVLAETPTLPPGTSDGWQELTAEFTTPNEASAVKISVVRRNCAEVSCPAFGHVWLDGFSLVRL